MMPNRDKYLLPPCPLISVSQCYFDLFFYRNVLQPYKPTALTTARRRDIETFVTLLLALCPKTIHRETHQADYALIVQRNFQSLAHTSSKVRF